MRWISASSGTAISRRASGTVNIGDRLSWSHPDRERGGAREETSGLPRFLVSAGPPVLALELLERNPQIEKAVVFSTTSVLTKHASDDEAERELMARILREESQLRAQCRRSGTIWLHVVSRSRRRRGRRWLRWGRRRRR